MSDQIVAWVRTVVPVAVGAAATWLAKRFGVHIDSTGVAAEVTLGVTAGYYLLVSTLERRWPVLGVLLGVPKLPSYATGKPPLETGGSAALEQLKLLVPPGTQIYVPPQIVTPKSYEVTIDDAGVHWTEKSVG